MKCSCPDWAGMCKHLAATLYGVGARLDTAPELLFTLRNVDHLELIGQAVGADNLERTFKGHADAALAGSDLGEIFGIDIDVSNGTKAEVPKDEAGASQDSLRRHRAHKKPALIHEKAKKTGRKHLAEPMVAATTARGVKKPAQPKRKARAGS